MSSFAMPLSVSAAISAVIFVALSASALWAVFACVWTPKLMTAWSGLALIVAVPFTVTVRSAVLGAGEPVSCASDGSVNATIAPSTTPAAM